jgi:division protein CdvB (Snf7/Vps24/ESCRT-III family)
MDEAQSRMDEAQSRMDEAQSRMDEAQSRMDEAKRGYFADKIIENLNDPKKLW